MDPVDLTNKLIEGYNLLLQQQSNHYNVILYSLTFIIGLVTALTTIWNFWASKQRIKENVSSEIKIFENKFNREKRLLVAKNQELAKNIREETNKLNADLSRNYALSNEENNFLSNASLWWSYAIYYYAECGKGKGLSLSTHSLLDVLEKPEWETQVKGGDMDKEEFGQIRNNINSIPDILDKEKSKIVSILKKVEARFN